MKTRLRRFVVACVAVIILAGCTQQKGSTQASSPTAAPPTSTSQRPGSELAEELLPQPQSAPLDYSLTREGEKLNCSQGSESRDLVLKNETETEGFSGRVRILYYGGWMRIDWQKSEPARSLIVNDTQWSLVGEDHLLIASYFIGSKWSGEISNVKICSKRGKLD